MMMSLDREEQAKADRKTMVPQIKEAARIDYLAKRKDMKIDELEQTVLDDEMLFRGESLTKVNIIVCGYCSSYLFILDVLLFLSISLLYRVFTHTHTHTHPRRR